ncbi:hypothetical protein Sjap_020269 [Stephania japonica]|uniref:Reverse transcriptase domain-containing protein n=1 Tax=Stephania japonica TaxID=461633 RepID=A0AAP0F0C0_9MAGN
MNPNRTPSLDGITNDLLQVKWEVLMDDIMNEFRRFHSSCHFEQGLNQAHIVLIPKVNAPQLVKEYRLICLCHQLADNVLLAHKILHSMANGNKRTQELVLKLNIDKAYDKFEWPMVLDVLKRQGFSKKRCRWIQWCISSVEYRVIINGELSRKIIPSGSLR